MEDQDDSSGQILEMSRFWVQRILVPVFVFVGVAGNTVTVMVLTRRRMRSSTNIYLSALAIADIIHLLFVFLLSFKHYSNIHDRRYELYWRFFGLTHWLCDAASSTSVWLTVSFTVERYIAVCHPIKGKIFCTENRAKTLIVIVYIFCILTTASTTFEYQLTLEESCMKRCNITQDIKKLHLISGNSLHHNGTTIHHYIPNHTLAFSNVKSGQFDSNPNFKYEMFLQSQLQNILSNCTSHPHVIYVPIYPHLLNLTNQKISYTNLIENQVINREEAPTTNHSKPPGAEALQESVLEKPPRKSEEKLDESDLLGSNTNDTENTTCCVKKFTIDTEYTNLGNNITYTTFMYWYSAIFFGLLPLVLIATFNCFLVHAVYLSQKTRKRMTNSQENISMSNENRITLMLIGVVILFLLCQTPTASLLIYNNFHQAPNQRAINIKLILGNIFNLLMVINASCNFLLYCVLSKKYRSTFKKLFFERKKRQDTIVLSSTKSRNSQRFNPYKHGIRRNASEYNTPRNLETQSLTGVPRSKSLMVRPVGKAKSTDLIV